MGDRERLDFRLLGPPELRRAGEPLPLGGRKQQTLLAALLLHRGEAVSTERLIDALWGERPPASAANSVYGYIFQLRETLGAERLTSDGHGYVVHVDENELDTLRFERLVAEGRAQLAADPAAATEKLGQALALWRGPPLAGLDYEGFARTEIERLNELRLTAREARLDAELQLGHSTEVIPELEALVAANPLRERLREQLMLALYRSGRQAEALETYRRAQRTLQDELGLEPSPGLRQLERAILSHDPALQAPVRAARVATARRGGLAIVAGGVVLAAAVAAAAALVATRGGGGLSTLAPGTLGVIDPHSSRIVAAIPIPGDPERVAALGRSIWVGSDGSATVSRIDARSPTVTKLISLQGFPSDLAVGRGSVWVFDGKSGFLSQIEPAYGVVSKIKIADANPAYDESREGLDPVSVAAGSDSVWLTDGSHSLTRVDPVTSKIVARIDLHQPLDGVAVGETSVWTISGPSSTLSRLDPRTGKVTRIPIASSPGFESPYPLEVAVGAGWVWVLNGNTATVTKVDPVERAVSATIPIGVEHGPARLAIGAGAAWVASSDGTLSRIDPASNAVHTVPVAHGLRGVAIADGRVWVTAGSGSGPIASPSLAAPHVLALPPSFCSPIYSRGGQPQYLIAADLPLQGFERAAAAQAGQAIQFVLREHGFRAGPYRVGYQACDDSTAASGGFPTPARCAANARNYANDRSVVGLIGPLFSGCSEVEVPILDRAPGGPLGMIAGQNTYVGLTHAGPGAGQHEPNRYYPTGIRNYVRIIAADDVQAAADALLAKRLRARRIYLVTDKPGNGYGVGLATAFTVAARELGLTVVGGGTWDYTHPGPRLMAAEANRRRADAVFIAAAAVDDPRVGILIRSLNDLGIRIIGPDAFSEFGKIVRFAGAAADGMMVSVPGLPNGRLPKAGKAFVAGFGRAVAQTPTQFSVYSAQATAILLDAIARSNGTRASVTAELFKTKVSNGILGTFAIDRHGDTTAAAITIYRIVDGQPRVLSVITPT